MTVTDIVSDTEARTLTVTARYDAPAERVWRLWADPRTLERWWGPPTYPATVTHHDLTPGGRVAYHMTGPEGDRHHGWWHVLAVDPPRTLAVEDGFADEHGAPDPTLPTTTFRVTISEDGPAATVMTIVSTFPTLAAMQQLAEMGMEEGLAAALSQTDALVGE